MLLISLISLAIYIKRSYSFCAMYKAKYEFPTMDQCLCVIWEVWLVVLNPQRFNIWLCSAPSNSLSFSLSFIWLCCLYGPVALLCWFGLSALIAPYREQADRQKSAASWQTLWSPERVRSQILASGVGWKRNRATKRMDIVTKTLFSCMGGFLNISTSVLLFLFIYIYIYIFKKNILQL